ADTHGRRAGEAGVNDGPGGGNADGPGGGIRSVVQKKRTTTVPLPTAISRASPARSDPREPTALVGPQRSQGAQGSQGAQDRTGLARPGEHRDHGDQADRKSTRLNSSH